MPANPAPSSPARIAPTMPSIIPDGAITSAPALAWLTDCSARSGSVASLSTSTRPPDSVSGPQWPWSVYSQQQTSVITSSPGACRLTRRIASWTIPLERCGRAACVLVSRDAEQQHGRDAQLVHLGDRLPQPVERPLILPRHRGDLPPEVLPVVDEQRIDQVIDRQALLADEVAEPGMAAEPSGTMEQGARGGFIGHHTTLEAGKSLTSTLAPPVPAGGRGEDRLAGRRDLPIVPMMFSLPWRSPRRRVGGRSP